MGVREALPGAGGAALLRPAVWAGCKHSDPEKPGLGSRAEDGRLSKPRVPGPRLRRSAPDPGDAGSPGREGRQERGAGRGAGLGARGGVRTWLRTAGWMSSAIVTLPCCSRRFTSLEPQMLTELSTCQRLYSTKERLSMTRGPPGPPRSRLASFLASITFLGSRSPAMAHSGQWGGGAP